MQGWTAASVLRLIALAIRGSDSVATYGGFALRTGGHKGPIVPMSNESGSVCTRTRAVPASTPLLQPIAVNDATGVLVETPVSEYRVRQYTTQSISEQEIMARQKGSCRAVFVSVSCRKPSLVYYDDTTLLCSP